MGLLVLGLFVLAIFISATGFVNIVNMLFLSFQYN